MKGPTHRTKCFFKNLIFWFSQHLLWPQACSNVGHKVFSSLQGSVDALFHSHSFHLGTNLLSLAQQPNRSKGKEQFSIWWYLRIPWKVKKKILMLRLHQTNSIWISGGRSQVLLLLDLPRWMWAQGWGPVGGRSFFFLFLAFLVCSSSGLLLKFP